MSSATATTTKTFVDKAWDESIVPTLIEYIKIPNKSPHFDPQWVERGHMDRAVALIEKWCRDHAIPGMSLEVVRLPNRTPLIFMEVPGKSDETILLYGHLDKQPEMAGWAEGLSPWTPVLKGDKLYGRGGADDGYAAFASLTALRALHDQGRPHARCVVMIEAGEESGSPDLEAYIEHLASRIGTPSLVICLDSGCGDYDHMWCTTSLRGLVSATLRVDVLDEGVHSGDAGGVVASSFRILRQLLSRIEDENTGRLLIDECHVEIPQQRLAQAEAVADVLKGMFARFPWHHDMRAMHNETRELILNRTWRPALAYTGIEGMPALENAGNVLRPYTALKLSFRLPPTANAAAANQRIKAVLTSEPPYGAHVQYDDSDSANGWNSPALAPWLEQAAQRASRDYFGQDALYMGEGGSIPFMGMLGERFPEAQFLITGVLGPNSNAHGPNEFLHIPTGKRLTCCVADVIEAHYQRNQK
jgi:acetylornithine deacetylase/succinyl-diaminopimelate desuccinylase-like protein